MIAEFFFPLPLSRLCRLVPAALLPAAASFLLLATSAIGQNAKWSEKALVDLLHLAEVVDILRLEGIQDAAELGSQIVSGGSDDRWSTSVENIYDYDIMRRMVVTGFVGSLSDAERDAIGAFFSTDLGQRIIRLENSAREAFMEMEIEEAGRRFAAELIEEQGPRTELLDDFIKINDLIEINVAGTMNSSFAFYLALAEGGAMEANVTESQILQDVWAQEDDIRVEVGEWLWSFLATAYRPLSDEELALYIDFSATSAGQALNRALAAGFDPMFNHLSRQVGLAAAERMKGDDL